MINDWNLPPSEVVNPNRDAGSHTINAPSKYKEELNACTVAQRVWKCINKRKNNRVLQ